MFTVYHHGFSPPAPATLTPSLPATMTAVVKPAKIPWSTTPTRGKERRERERREFEKWRGGEKVSKCVETYRVSVSEGERRREKGIVSERERE